MRGLASCLTIALLCQVSLSYNDLYDWRVSQNRAELTQRLLHSAGYALLMIAAVVLMGLAIANERATREDLKDASQLNFENNVQTQRNLRNTEAIEAMGMLPKLRDRWQDRHDRMVGLQMRANRRGGVIATTSKTFRMLMQSMMLGIGAYLAIQGEISAGAVIAGSLLLGRALAPINQAIGSWKGFVSARDAYGRLNKLLELLPAKETPMPLPPPQGHVEFDQAVVKPQGADAAIIKGISFVGSSPIAQPSTWRISGRWRCPATP